VKEKASKEANICGFRLYAEKDNAAAQDTYRRIGMNRIPYVLYEESFQGRKSHVEL
jgi:ribosomal protein S18 acetylase RimI-like enzyme